MKQTTLASLILAAVAAAPALAVEITPETQAIITQAVTDGTSVEDAITDAIAQNPELAPALAAAAITELGVDSDEALDLLSTLFLANPEDEAYIVSIMDAAIEAGVDPDTVTGIAIASGVDATIASLATAAGPEVAAGNVSQFAGASAAGAGGGGGAGGISGGQ